MLQICGKLVAELWQNGATNVLNMWQKFSKHVGIYRKTNVANMWQPCYKYKATSWQPWGKLGGNLSAQKWQTRENIVANLRNKCGRFVVEI